MNKIASEYRLSMSGLVDEKKAIKVGKVLRAQYLILGEEGLIEASGFLAEDIAPSVDYRDGTVWSGPEVWGTPAGAVAA